MVDWCCSRALSLLSSFLEANGLGGPSLWGNAILLLQALHLAINAFLESKFLLPMLMAPSPTNWLPLCLSLYFVLLQLAALLILLLHLALAIHALLLPLIGVHLLLIASILAQLLQLLFSSANNGGGHANLEMFIWFWYISACLTFTLYQAMLFSTSRPAKLSASIAPATSRVRRIWIPPAQQPQQQNRRPSSSGRPLMEANA